MALPPGTRLGPYDVLSTIGRGGMGEVHRVRDTRLDRIAAVKTLSTSLAADPVFRERFEREATTLSGLSHPNVCAVDDIGREGTHPSPCSPRTWSRTSRSATSSP